MGDEPVRVVSWKEQWSASFDREAELLGETIGAWASGGIHHVGSTAVRGLAAKPVIDIMVGVESLEGSRECIGLLEEIGYLYAPYRSEKMHWLCKPDPALRTHHLHLVPSGSARFRATRAFAIYCGQIPSWRVSTKSSSASSPCASRTTATAIRRPRSRS